MEQLNHLNAEVSSADLNDAIYSKLQKSKAILTSVMFASEFIRSDTTVLDNHTIYHALWAVEEYLAEIENLLHQSESISQ